METFFDRMKWLVDKFGKGRKHTFGKMLMIPKGTMQRYVEDRIPDPEYLVRIHETFNVNLNWLFTGKGEPLIIDDTSELEKLRTILNAANERLSELEKANSGKIRKDDPVDKKSDLIKMRNGVVRVEFNRKNNGT